MSTSKRRPGGKLFLIGGAADTCFKSFAAMAGGTNARVLLVPHASENARENGESLAADLRAIGCAKVDLILPSDPFAIPRGTTGIYLMGGDQSRLVELLGAKGKRALKRYLARGGFIAGSSAGAAGAARHMIADGMSDHKLVEGSLKTGRGLGLVPDMVIDTHFMERNRYNRPMAAQLMARHGVFVVGLDEDTGIIIEPGVRATVHGAGCANFYVPQDLFVARHSQPDGKPNRLSIGNVLVSFLSQGASFDLVTLEPQVP